MFVTLKFHSFVLFLFFFLSCIFEDTRLGMGGTYLLHVHVSTMRVTTLHAQVYKVTSLDF